VALPVQTGADSAFCCRGRGERAASRIRNPSRAAEYRRTVTAAAHYPAVDGIIVGIDSTVWIRMRPTRDGVGHLALDHTGAPLGTVLLPPRSRVATGTREALWAVESDALDVQSLVRDRIHRQRWRGTKPDVELQL